MPLSPLPRVSSRSRGVRTRRSRRDRRQPSRVNEGAALTIRDTFRLTSSFAPRRPLERPAPDSPVPRLGHRGFPVVDTFSPACGSLRIPPTARPPSTCPAANGSHASLGLGIARRLLQPVFATRGHTLRAFVPRTRVGLSPRCSPAPTDAGCVGLRGALPHRGPASHDLHASALTAAFHSRGRGRSWAEALERRRAARSLTMSRVPSSWRFGHPGHRFDWLRGLESLEARRPGQDPTRMPPREGRHRRKDRGAFCRAGTLTRAEDGSSVRAWTAAPSRRLRGGIARGLARLFHRFSGAFF